jgi:hypothetical protein
MLAWLSRQSSHRVSAEKPATGCHPELTALEDRTTPTVSTITGNFNGTAIPAGDSLWFSSVAKIQNLPASGDTLHVTHQTISFTANGVSYSYAVPDATINLSPNTTDTTVSTDAAGDWIVDSPTHFSGNVFLAGVSVPLPAGLPGGIKNVSWSGDFSTDTVGVKVNWQWAAAAYSQLAGTDATALGVKPADQKTVAYPNSDHAGTPEIYRADVVGGGTGGGGSNWTGSLSATASVTPSQFTPAQSQATISGFVTDGGGFVQPGVTVTLSGMSAQGKQITLTTVTNPDGSYNFSVAPGTYTLSEQPPATENGLQYVGSQATYGQIDGLGGGNVVGGTSLINVTLNAGDAGTQFNFTNNYTGGS